MPGVKTEQAKTTKHKKRESKRRIKAVRHNLNKVMKKEDHNHSIEGRYSV